MSDGVPVRLGAYGVLLVAIFVAAWLVGGWVGPVGQEHDGRGSTSEPRHQMEEMS